VLGTHWKGPADLLEYYHESSAVTAELPWSLWPRLLPILISGHAFVALEPDIRPTVRALKVLKPVDLILVSSILLKATWADVVI
jgi:hypothetical protein